MKYIIIGLGNYGGGLAEELMAIGHEVRGFCTGGRFAETKESEAYLCPGYRFGA